MGFLDLFRKPKTPTVGTILPDAAKQEIRAGRLPILRSSKVFLKANETCHYIDKAIYEKKTVRKRYVRRNFGYSMPGLFKGTRIHLGDGETDVVDNVSYEMLRGVLFITNRRVIFLGDRNGFEKSLDDLLSTTPWGNCIELQFSKETYRIFVPDGTLVDRVLHLVK